MEMTQESLMAAGFTKEQATQILETHKAAINGQYVPKARFDEVNTSLTQAKATITERDTQITTLKAFEGTNAELQAKITALTEENATKAAEAATAIATEKKNAAMKLALTGKVHDADLVLSQLDTSKITIGDDGKLVGFEEQLNPLKESKQFLFVADTASKPNNSLAGIVIAGTTPPEGSGSTTPQNTTPESFGAELAKQRLATMQAATKAGDAYFKGGN